MPDAVPDILEFLELKLGGPPKCSVCGHEGWVVRGATVAPYAEAYSQADYTKGLGLVVLECTNCFYALTFTARIVHGLTADNPLT